MNQRIKINGREYRIQGVQNVNGISHLKIIDKNGVVKRVDASLIIVQLFETKVREDMNHNKFHSLEEMRTQIMDYKNYLGKDPIYQNLLTIEPNLKVDMNLMDQTLKKLLQEYHQKNENQSLNLDGMSNRSYTNTEGYREEFLQRQVNKGDNPTLLDNKVRGNKTIEDQFKDQLIDNTSIHNIDGKQNANDVFKDFSKQKEEIQLYPLREMNMDKLTKEERKMLTLMKAYEEKEHKEIVTNYNLSIFIDKATGESFAPVVKNDVLYFDNFEKQEANTKTKQAETISKDDEIIMGDISQVDSVEITLEERKYIDSLSEQELQELLSGNNYSQIQNKQKLISYIKEVLEQRKTQATKDDSYVQEKPKVYTKTMENPSSGSLGYVNVLLLSFLMGTIGGMVLLIVKSVF